MITTPADPALIRAACLFVPLATMGALWVWRRPDTRQRAAVLLASAWQVPSLLALHLVAAWNGWWDYGAEGGMLLGFPVDVWLGWVVAWGAIPALLPTGVPAWRIAAVLVALDLVAMPAAAPVVRLGGGWLWGEGLGLALCFLPGHVLARWTVLSLHLPRRAVLQAVCFSALFFVVLTTAILERTGGRWETLFARPIGELVLAAQLLALPAAVGLAAVREFVVRGGGTPLPYDPPQRLVTTGPYAYVANPMQLAMVVLFAGWGALLGSAWVMGAAAMSAAYSVGMASWDERSDLGRRFGGAWRGYRRHVRNWWPRWRPWCGSAPNVATLYLADSCPLCRQTRAGLASLRPLGMCFAPAEEFPGPPPRRMTYVGADGDSRAAGVAALAHTLEHVHLGWALMGWCLRLPLVSQLAQVLVDAVGGGPRSLAVAGSTSASPHPLHPARAGDTLTGSPRQRREDGSKSALQ